MISQPHIIYYRENAASKCYKLYRIQHQEIPWDIPESLSVQKQIKYQSFDFGDMPLITLATGKTCQVYTLHNWDKIKKNKKYEFLSQDIQQKYTQKSELNKNTILVPYYSHVTWYKEAEHQWKRESTLSIEAAHVLFPRAFAVHNEHSLKSIRFQLTQALQQIKKKSKMTLNVQK